MPDAQEALVHDSLQPPENRFDLCTPFLTSLPISGATVSVIGRGGMQLRVAASGDVAARLDELQFELGEGPQRDCHRTGKPVLVPDLESDSGTMWPMFTLVASTLPVRAIFALPLMLGAEAVGVVCLDRRSRGSLTEEQLSDAITITAAIAGLAVDLAFRSASRDNNKESIRSPGLRRNIHQAVGMISVQLNASATDAFARLQAHVFATGNTMQEAASEVLERRLDFADLPD